MILSLFTEKDRLADVIAANHELIFTLPRFGITLGFGEQTVAQVCEKHQVETRLFLIICNIYTFTDYLPDVTILSSNTLANLIPYLTASHRYYLEERIPHIEHHLTRIEQLGESQQASLLVRFFADYKKEVEGHFVYEEEEVFPYVRKLATGEKSVKHRISDSHSEHDSMEDKLHDLTLLILKYFPANISTNDPFSVVLDIFRLSADLNRHALIEDKLLIPYLHHLEEEEGRI